MDIQFKTESGARKHDERMKGLEDRKKAKLKKAGKNPMTDGKMIRKAEETAAGLAKAVVEGVSSGLCGFLDMLAGAGGATERKKK